MAKIDWMEILKLAEDAGTTAANQCPPNPVRQTEGELISQGACGFAYIRFDDPRTAFVRWLKANNIGDKAWYGEWEIRANPLPGKNDWWGIQSHDPKLAYAKAFAKVLQENGIKCTASSDYD